MENHKSSPLEHIIMMLTFNLPEQTNECICHRTTVAAVIVLLFHCLFPPTHLLFDCPVVKRACCDTMWCNLNRCTWVPDLNQIVLHTTPAAQAPICNLDVGSSFLSQQFWRALFCCQAGVTSLKQRKLWVRGEDNKPGVLPVCREWQQVCRTPLQTAGWPNRWGELPFTDISLKTQRWQWVELRSF